jgi:hypothetical protein
VSDPNDLDRLLDDGADDFERTLLRSAKRDRMQPDRKRVLAAGIGTAAGGATLLGATKAAAAAKGGAKLGTLALVKWLGIGLATVAATAGTARLVIGQQAHEAPEAPVTVATVATTPSARPGVARVSPPAGPKVADEAPPAIATIATTIPSEVPAPIVARRDVVLPASARSAPSVEPALAPIAARTEASSVPAPAPIAEATPPPSATTAIPSTEASRPRAPASYLDEQLALLGKARAALDANDAPGAVRALDAYGARFPQGSLGEEAELLRVRATAQAGDGAGARRLAQAFLTRHPTSPYAARARSFAEAK